MSDQVRGPAAGGRMLLPALPISDGEARRARIHALRRHAPTAIGSTVLSYARAVADQNPDRVALDSGERTVSYQDLVRGADAVAGSLAAAGCVAGDVVAVTAVRNADLPIAFLGIEAVGGVYLPIGVDWPAHRVATILRDSGARLLLDTRAEEAGKDTAGIDVACEREGVARLGSRAARAAAPGLVTDHPDDVDEARYLLYTSGSTGRPKGVLVRHRGLLNHLWGKIQDLGLDAEDRIGFTAPPTFDISLWQMLAAFLVGARTVVVGSSDIPFARPLLQILARSHTTVAQFVPSHLQIIVDEIRRNSVSADGLCLRYLLSIGEKLSPALAGECLRLLPGTVLVNSYGPTECADGVSHHRVGGVDVDQLTIPIGTPLPNTSLYVLKESAGEWRACLPAETGELFIGGWGVGVGYLGDAAETGRAFRADCLDPDSPTGAIFRTGDLVRLSSAGTLEYLHRVDRQVKVSGVRIEPDEVEAVVRSHPGVRSCAVVLSERVGSARLARLPELVAFYVGDRKTSEEDLASHARGRLPPAMVPRRWVAVAALPLTAHGKVDYHSLGEKGDDGAGVGR